MEIVMDNVWVKSTKKDQCISSVNYTFLSDKITFCSGLSGKVLRDLLMGNKKCSSGLIYVKPGGVLRDIGYVANDNSKTFKYKNMKEELRELYKNYDNIKSFDEKMINSLKMVGINERFLERNFSSLSTIELKKVALACVLFNNPKIVIFDYFEKEFTYKDLDYLKKLMVKLKNKYNKSFIVCSDDIGKFIDVLDEVVLFDKGRLVYSGNRNNLYDDIIYNYIDKPAIVEFVKLLNSRGHTFLEYVDIKELIKAIYREVGNK